MSVNNNVISRTKHLPEDQRLQEGFALAAFATIRADEIAYISAPITSGRRLYDYMDSKGFKTAEEAQEDRVAFFKHVITPNLSEAAKDADIWSKKIKGPIIEPVNFEKSLRTHDVAHWNQDAFMGMWIPVIREKVTHMIMADGWQYSNGCGEEYLQAVLMQMGRNGRRSRVQILDEQGAAITLDKGVELMTDAFRDLQARGLKPRNMAETIAKLLEAEHRFNFEQSFNRSAEPDRRRAKQEAVPPYDHKNVEAARKEFHATFAAHYPDILPVLKRTSSFDYSPVNALFSVGKIAAAKCAVLAT